MAALSFVGWAASIAECAQFWFDEVHDPIRLLFALQFLTLGLVADICLRVARQ